MISQSHRFHGRGSLNRVYRKGQTVRGQDISLKYAANPRRRTYRAAVVVSRKVHKSAVKRNRIRRRIYEALRAADPEIIEPYDLVFIIYGEQFAEMDFANLQAIIQTLLKKSGVKQP